MDELIARVSPPAYTGVVLGFFRVQLGPLALSPPLGWGLGLRASIALALISLFALRFKYLLEARVA